MVQRQSNYSYFIHFDKDKAHLNFIYIYSLKMHLGSDHMDCEHFDNLLDFSSIDHHHSVTSHDLSPGKEKFNFMEKEKTREESYQEIAKQVNTSKLEQMELKKELERVKQQIYRDYLGRFQEEFDDLNQENRELRKELNSMNAKKRQDKYERKSNRSSIKVRSSINSVYGNQNKRTSTKPTRNYVSPNVILKKKEAKLTESSAFLGRSQVTSPVNHKRRESQLTERKIQENYSNGISFNCSFAEDKGSQCNFRQSVSRNSLKPEVQQKNVFINILQNMLKEQKALDNQKYAQIYLESTRVQVEGPSDQIVFINSLQNEVKQTNDKLQILNIVINRYQEDIEGTNMNLKVVTQWIQKLYSVKGRYVQMEKKCNNLISLRKQVSQKETILAVKALKMENETIESKSIASIETLIKIFTNNSHKTFPQQPSKLYMVYYRQIKELFKFDKEDQVKRNHKMVKVREMIDGIRQSRSKFNELIGIYEGRIFKLEEKLTKILKRQSQKSKKASAKADYK